MSNAAVLKLQQGDLAPGRPYLELIDAESSWPDRLARALWHQVALPLVGASGARQRQARALVARVDALGAEMAAMDNAALRAQARALRPSLRQAGFTLATVARVFAVAREAGTRVLGLRHHDTQLMAGWWLLQGSLVEMATGEGKTFATTLPALTAALAGLPVHVITVNDYLASRDAATLAPLYQFFGLKVNAVVNGLTPDARRIAYAGDVTYASNKELAFDYLRDRSSLGDRASRLHLAVESLRDQPAINPSIVLRGLVFGIVDEADSVFIDEARTPLILSRASAPPMAVASTEAAMRIAAELQATSDFLLEPAQRRIRITEAGYEAIAELATIENGAAFASERELNEAVERALAALHLYARDQQYVVVDGKVQIVDEATGRAMPDRSWERGLHQMIETKEGLAVTGSRETLARITYQRLFRRYLRLAGMSGTAAEVAVEIGLTYGLPVVRVPLHRPSRHRMNAARCFVDESAKWQAVVAAVERVALQDRRPVLVGTRTVKASETISELLSARGIEHTVLNAKQDRDEAETIGRAGELGRVTVATNMAGRGTDIALSPGVAGRGGLHVIVTEYHESPRIDRQLFGRSARQGEPGSGEAIIALDDELFATHVPRLARWCARLAVEGRVGPRWIALLRRVAQTRAEGRNRDIRVATVKQDRRFARLLAFAGRGE